MFHRLPIHRWLPVVGAVALSLLASCGQNSAAGDPTTTTSGSPVPTATGVTSGSTDSANNSCQQLVESMDLAEKVGQLYMIPVGTDSLSRTEELVTAHQIGSVLYLGATPSGVTAVREMSQSIRNAGSFDVPVLMGVDQEGGAVQRLTGAGFDTIPSAREQAAMTPEQLTRSWAGWGAQLVQAGVHYDLAPVADVVPADMTSTNAPIGKLGRGYGSTAEQVSVGVDAVIRGLGEAQVATAVKHFPGLGLVRNNTDFGFATDTETTVDDLASFRSAIASGVSSVMVSSALYTKIDRENRAVFSRRIITELLRDELGFDKVIISDDLGAAEAVSDVPAAERGVRFLAAGGDLVIDADLQSVPDMVNATIQRVESDDSFAGQLDDKVLRVLRMKSEVGLVECGS